MSRTIVIEWFTTIVLLVTALSHILQPRAWAEFFLSFIHKPYAGFIIGLPTLLIGLPITFGHNDWALRPTIIVTIVGWGWTVKGALYMLVPTLPARVAKEHLQRPERFRIAGAVLAALSLILAGAMLMRESQ